MPAHFWFGDRSRPTYTIYMKKLRDRTPRVKQAKASGKKLSTKGPPRRESKWSYETDYQNVLHVDKETFDRARVGRAGVASKYFDYENTELQRVDELICEFMGEPKPDRSRDSHFYHAMHEIAFWKLYGMGGSHIEERHVREMQKNVLWFRGEKPHDFIGPLRIDEEYKGLSERYVSEGEVGRRQMLVEWVFLHKWRYGASG